MIGDSKLPRRVLAPVADLEMRCLSLIGTERLGHFEAVLR